MSLPDTAFIFILALIIFGPKKLPEIGRQLGRLVGEFRRASNEFKFQIEEELRLADLTDSPKRSAPYNTTESSISEPDTTTGFIDSETEDSTTASDTSDLTYGEDTLPVGQHPNVEYQDHYELNDFDENSTESESVGDMREGETSGDTASTTDTAPMIRAADGTQPRTTLPYSSPESAVSPVEQAMLPAVVDDPASSASTADIPSVEATTSTPEHVPADSNAASTVAGISHG